MMYYFVNTDQTQNPGLHHEVHSIGCLWGDQILYEKRISLGLFPSATEAVTAAKRFYADADGCKTCCPEAHTG